MYNVRKVLTLDSSPLIRLEKRLASLKHTHNAGLARSAFLTENNLNVNRQLMESLILRLHSVDSKSKKNKRVANRMKIGSPKRIRSVGGKSQEMFNANYSGYSGFHSKLNTVKRMNPSEFCDSSDSTFLKDLKELPPLHPSEVETVLRKKDAGLRNVSQKVEPIFPPPPDPSCTVTPRTSAPTLNRSCNSGTHRLRKGAQLFNQTEHANSKYSTPTTSGVTNFGPATRQGTLPVPSIHSEPYSYVDFQTKYDPSCYPSMSSGYDQFSLPRFPNDYGNFNPYARSPGYSAWASLGKYDQSAPNRISQNPISASMSGTSNYGSYLTTTAPGNPGGFTTNLPFNSSFQNENFIQNIQSYTSSLDSQQPAYGMNLSTYNYPQPSVPPNTTSYL